MTGDALQSRVFLLGITMQPSLALHLHPYTSQPLCCTVQWSHAGTESRGGRGLQGQQEGHHESPGDSPAAHFK
ncbi:UNVERIFIED_CONTAM: hypothetical protein FKN15_056190 [Acipenser sinensis]